MIMGPKAGTAAALVGLLALGGVAYADPPARRGSSEQVIRGSRLLPVPLVPTEEGGARAEDDALVLALQRFDMRGEVDVPAALEDFLARHSESRWTAALQVNLGLFYKLHGYPSRAMKALTAALDLTLERVGNRELESISAVALVEHAELLAAFGRTEELREVFDGLAGRSPLRGAGRRADGIDPPRAPGDG